MRTHRMVSLLGLLASMACGSGSGSVAADITGAIGGSGRGVDPRTGSSSSSMESEQKLTGRGISR
jgi:outer membrane lipoprotein SlyB